MIIIHGYRNTVGSQHRTLGCRQTLKGHGQKKKPVIFSSHRYWENHGHEFIGRCRLVYSRSLFCRCMLSVNTSCCKHILKPLRRVCDISIVQVLKQIALRPWPKCPESEVRESREVVAFVVRVPLVPRYTCHWWRRTSISVAPLPPRPLRCV